MIARLNPIAFASAEQEAAFYRSYFIEQRSFVQAALLMGGFVMYIFFVWDKIIDPRHYEQTQLIRASLGTTVIWLMALLLYNPRCRIMMEGIICLAVVNSAVVLALVFSILDRGYDYGSVGIVILIFFVCALLPIRLPYFVLACLASAIVFNVGEYFSTSPGSMYLPNNICLWTSITLGIFSLYWRETAARAQFINNIELEAAKKRVEDLMSCVLSPDEVARMRDGTFNRRVLTKIVLSYRRADSGAITGRIHDSLVHYFGPSSIFMDIDSIPIGMNFREHIEKELSKASIVLVIVGTEWLGPNPTATHRIHDGADPVRIEVETAFRLGLPIIPVLIRGATMPGPSDLPTSLRRFADLNAIEIDSGRDFKHHIERLVRSVDALTPRSAAATAETV